MDRGSSLGLGAVTGFQVRVVIFDSLVSLGLFVGGQDE